MRSISAVLSVVLAGIGEETEETRSLERGFLIPAELRTQSFFSKEEES